MGCNDFKTTSRPSYIFRYRQRDPETKNAKNVFHYLILVFFIYYNLDPYRLQKSDRSCKCVFVGGGRVCKKERQRKKVGERERKTVIEQPIWYFLVYEFYQTI
jgi:hypothetical protein